MKILKGPSDIEFQETINSLSKKPRQILSYINSNRAQIGSIEYIEQIFQIAVDNGLFTNCSLNEKLYLSAQGGSVKYLNEFLQNNADVNFINTDGLTPLIIASNNGHKLAVELLLKYKADLNYVAHGSVDAYTTAKEQGYNEICELLINNGYENKRL